MAFFYYSYFLKFGLVNFYQALFHGIIQLCKLSDGNIAMPSPISLEVREKIVEAYQKGVGTQSYIADIFGTTRRTVNKLVNKALNGDLAVKKQTGRPASIDHK